MTDEPTGDPGTAVQPTRVRWLIFVLACAMSWLLYLHRYAWGVIKPSLKQDAGLSDLQLGWLDSAFSLTYACCQVPAGLLGDLFGLRGIMAGMILLWSACLAALGIPQGFASLCGVRALFGAAQAGAYPGLAKVTRNWYPPSIRTSVQGAVAAFSGRVGGMFAYLVIPLMLPVMNWQLTLGALSSLGVLLAAAFWLCFRDTPILHPWTNSTERSLVAELPPRSQAPQDQSQEQTAPARSQNPYQAPQSIAATSREPGESMAAPKVASRPQLDWSLANLVNFGIFLLHAFTSTFADMLYVNWIASYLVESHGYSKGQLMLGMLPLAGGALGGMLGGMLNDLAIRATGNRRLSRSMVGFSGKVISAGLIAWSVSIADGALVMLVLFACKFFTDWSQPTQWGAATDIAGPATGTVFGVMNTVGSCAGIVAGPVIPYIKVHHGWDGVFYAIACVYFVSGACWLFFDCTRKLFRE